MALARASPDGNATSRIASSWPSQNHQPPQSTQLEHIKRPANAYLRPLGNRCPSPTGTVRSEFSIDECCEPRVKAKGKPSGKMGLSKSNRIILLLAIDSVFFLLELSIGYAVHSLALVADSFHMLNDVLSLCVGLWAVRVANTKDNSKMYTYGWQRAETLGALVNGVFLVALCLSIFLDAIQRFVEPQVVTNPKLVLIVGCFGLASNIIGLFLFHDHSHGHGEEGEHSHGGDPVSHAEEGHAHIDVEGRPHNKSRTSVNGRDFDASDEDNTTISGPTSGASHRKASANGGRNHRKSGSFGRGFGSVDSLHVHPASIRQGIIVASRVEEEAESEAEEEALVDDTDAPMPPNETSSLLKRSDSSPTKHGHSHSSGHASPNKKKQDHRHDSWHDSHHHSRPKDADAKGGHGHSHGDLNMRGVFLHVMGDALGNVGVIGSALFIWLTSYSWRYYIDPGVSLIITIIILTSAIPLCKAASRILLQAVPIGMSVDDIRSDIESLPGVMSCHHLHVWQLSDTKLVASLHVRVDCEVEGTGSASYMHLARQIRKCLHEYGIHSSTIQPEFCLPPGADEHSSQPGSKKETRNGSSATTPRMELGSKSSKPGSMRSEPEACLLDCDGDECGSNNQCCPSDAKDVKK